MQKEVPKLRRRKLNESGVTLQTVIIVAVLALAATGAGVVIYNAVGSSSENVSENAAGIDGLRSTRLNDVKIGLGGSKSDPNSELNAITGTAVCRDDGRTVTRDLRDCRPCPPGSAGTGGNCRPCQPNEVIQRISGSAGGTECVACDAGQISSPDREVCCSETNGDTNQDGMEDSRCNPATAEQQAGGVGEEQTAHLVSVGEDHVCAVVGGDRHLYCWGDNSFGQLGLGATGQSSTPVQIQEQTSGTATPLTDVHAVSASQKRTCAVAGGDRHLYCWGSNTRNRLGTGNTGQTPVQILESGGSHGMGPYLTDVRFVSVGSFHTCAIVGETDRALYCWGRNTSGELGNGNPVFSVPTPVQVLAEGGIHGEGPYLNDVHAVSARIHHTCAIVGGDRHLYCWGSNNQEGLGDGTSSDRLTPVQVLAEGGILGEGPYLTRVASVSEKCAVVSNGDNAVYCWGPDKQLEKVPAGEAPDDGDGYLTDADIKDDSISSGGASCVIAGTEKGVYCWGEFIGGMDNGRIVRRNNLNPDRVLRNGETHLTDATAVSTSEKHGCAIASGSVYCWSYDATGGLGAGTTFRGPTAVQATGLSGKGFLTEAHTVSGSGNTREHTCVVIGSSRAVYCWGDNYVGQLGIGTSGDNSPTPVQVLAGESPGDEDGHLTDVHSISAGSGYNCAVVGANRDLYCWGDNTSGELGNGFINEFYEPRMTPVQVLKGESQGDADGHLTDVHSVSAGNTHTCAVAGTNRDLYCWGDNSHLRLGDGTSVDNSPTPVQVLAEGGIPGEGPYLADVHSVSAGRTHTCAVAGANRDLYCWGDNSHGQLGIIGKTGSTTPVQVLKGESPGDANGHLTDVHSVSVSIGRNTCAAAGEDSRLYCWGDNSQGQLGDGRITQSNTPVLVKGALESVHLTGVTSIRTPSNLICAVADPGNTVYCWGDNSSFLVTQGGTTAEQVAISAPAPSSS